MSTCLYILLVLSSIEIIRVAAISLTIRPDHLRLNADNQSITFTCTADVALAGCQFKWWDGSFNNIPGPLLELSRGPQSQANPRFTRKDSLTGYSYSGRGLGSGDCGITLQVKGIKNWIVICRVRGESVGWKYAWADMITRDDEPLPYNLTTPREVVVLPGGEARFSLVTREPLERCVFQPTFYGNPLFFNEGAESANSTGRHLYIGAGLQRGQCGLALTNVSDADNGMVQFVLDAPTYRADNGFIMFFVARPPTAPILTLIYTASNVTATCEVQSRPVAKISWVLGDEIIRQDENDDTQAGSKDEWRWPWNQRSIQQTLTLQLQPQHNGKELKCRVSHIALAQPLELKSTISS